MAETPISKSGTAITDRVAEKLADEAERGYDLEVEVPLDTLRELHNLLKLTQERPLTLAERERGTALIEPLLPHAEEAEQAL